MRDIAHEDRIAADLRHRECIDAVDHIRTVIHRQCMILAADLHISGRQNDVLALQRIAHVGRRQAARRQGPRIQIRHDHSRLATVGLRHLCAVHHRQIGQYQSVPGSRRPEPAAIAGFHRLLGGDDPQKMTAP